MRGREVTAFSRTAARWIGGLALLSLVASFWLLLRPGERSQVTSVDADGYSRSAIGHQGLLRLLRELERPVVQRRHERSLEGCGLLVLAEPRFELLVEEVSLEQWIDQARATLVVLPKRRGTRDAVKPYWNDEVSLLDLEEVAAPLRRLTEERPWWWRAPEIQRVPATSGWTAWRALPAPEFAGPVQLLARGGTRMEPLIECDQGVLLAKIGGVHLLSDPDLIANHGLLRGDNASLALAAVDELHEFGAIVFDETTHGHRMEPSVWSEFGRFPLVLVPVHLLVVLALALWIASGRFGRPLPLPPPIGAGKAFLIDNIVALVQRGGEHGPALRRYARMRVREAARRLHAPVGATHEQNVAWLRARLADETLRVELAALNEIVPRQLKPAEAIEVARRIYRITEERPHVIG